MPPLPNPALRQFLSHACGLALIALGSLLSSCTSSSPQIKGIPSDLPSIPLYGSARTPSHSMKRSDYPFDASGNYVTAWAAEGGASAGPSGYSRSRHHEDTPPRRSSSSSTRSRSTASSTPKKVTSSSGSSTKSSSTSTPAKKTSGGSSSHVVKSNDTLWGLAKKYGTTVAKIKAANGLKSDVLRDGHTLSIPK